ncbi:MAG: transporter substrate-binding domain-containing protein [Rhodobacteraceae bacterium]|nr:transporter substrate-binding domain-containing protein [Paracoccaceae bacterium]
MKKLIIAAAVSALTAGTALADTVRLGTEGAYPPYNFVNDAGEIDGYERELGDAICAKAGLECTWVKNDWDSIIPNLVSSNYDAIIAGMSITDERDEVIDFTSEYFPADPSGYMALAGSDVDVSAGVIAAQVNTIQASHVASSSATLVEFATPDETIAAVQNGEADAVLADRGYLQKFVDESGGKLVFVGDGIIIGGGVGMGVRESDGELKGKLNDAIAALKADGTVNTLIEKWFEGMTGPY